MPGSNTPRGYDERREHRSQLPRLRNPLRPLRARRQKEEVSAVAGVSAVEVDLATKLVVVRGEALDDSAIRAAIEEAGYEAA
jgi:hypothetical protein